VSIFQTPEKHQISLVQSREKLTAARRGSNATITKDDLRATGILPVPGWREEPVCVDVFDDRFSHACQHGKNGFIPIEKNLQLGHALW
jgi:hypothetical protein